MRIALSQHKQLCKVNVKKQQSDPRHKTPNLGSPGAATIQLVAIAAFDKEQQQKTRNVIKI
jgi:hypothetical protein